MASRGGLAVDTRGTSKAFAEYAAASKLEEMNARLAAQSRAPEAAEEEEQVAEEDYATAAAAEEPAVEEEETVVAEAEAKPVTELTEEHIRTVLSALHAISAETTKDPLAAHAVVRDVDFTFRITNTKDKDGKTVFGEPTMVTMSPAQWTRLFDGKVDFSREVFLHSFVPVASRNSLPLVLGLTARNVTASKKALEIKGFSTPGVEPVTLTILPGNNTFDPATTAPLHTMAPVAPDYLGFHGYVTRADIQSAFQTLHNRKRGNNAMFLDTEHPLSGLFADHVPLWRPEAKPMASHSPEIEAVYVPEKLAVQVVDEYGANVINGFDKTAAGALGFELSRIDRPAPGLVEKVNAAAEAEAARVAAKKDKSLKKAAKHLAELGLPDTVLSSAPAVVAAPQRAEKVVAKAFADVSDAPGLTPPQVDNAHEAGVHEVTITMRTGFIERALFDKYAPVFPTPVEEVIASKIAASGKK